MFGLTLRGDIRSLKPRDIFNSVDRLRTHRDAFECWMLASYFVRREDDVLVGVHDPYQRENNIKSTVLPDFISSLGTCSSVVASVAFVLCSPAGIEQSFSSPHVKPCVEQHMFSRFDSTTDIIVLITVY